MIFWAPPTLVMSTAPTELLPDLFGHPRVVGVDEAGPVQVEGDAAAVDIGLARMFRVGGNQFAVLVDSAEVPEFRVGDDPPLVVEHEGIVAALVAGEDGGEASARIDMLGELHQVAVIEGDHDHAVELAALVPQGSAESDDAPVLLALIGFLRFTCAGKLLVSQYMEAGQVGDMDLPRFQHLDPLEVILAAEFCR